jgi:hypothetical protein
MVSDGYKDRLHELKEKHKTKRAQKKDLVFVLSNDGENCTLFPHGACVTRKFHICRYTRTSSIPAHVNFLFSQQT